MLLFYHGFINKKYILGNFFIPYLIHLIPFLIVNGLLTSIPVVIYNDNENLGLRIFTIPVEDTIYALTMMLGVITIYEKKVVTTESKESLQH
jgi:lycopene cyclase domain-containing protein